MTPEEIQATRALVDAATPAPWEHERVEFRDQVSHAVRVEADDDWNGVVAHAGYGPADSRAEADAEFIATARLLVPRLLDALKEAQAEIARVKAHNGECGTCDGYHGCCEGLEAAAMGARKGTLP